MLGRLLAASLLLGIAGACPAWGQSADPNREQSLANFGAREPAALEAAAGAGLGASCLAGIQSGALREGWSGYFAASSPGDPGRGADANRGFAGGMPPRSYQGYPFTYEDMGNGGSGYEAHVDGEIWAATLWDLRKSLGQAVAGQLVLNGLKSTPCNPSMTGARDAILSADQAATGGANRAALWQVFARHGLGYSAFGADGGPAAGTRYDAAFDLPPGMQPARNPAISSDPLSIETAMGDLYSYTVTASNPNGGTLNYALVQGPAGMTVDSATGLAAWTAGFTGQRVQIAVTDGRGGRVVHGYLLPVVTALSPGVPVTVDGDAGSTGYASIAVPANAPALQVSLRCAPPVCSGDADLRVADPGGRTSFAARDGAGEVLSFVNPEPGLWWIEVRGSSKYSKASLEATLLTPSAGPAVAPLSSAPAASPASAPAVGASEGAAATASQTSGPAANATASLVRVGTLSHIAAGDVWDTAISLINASYAPIGISLVFHANDGSALTLPLTVTQQGATQSVTTATLNATINPETVLVVDAGNPSVPLAVGWADVLATGPVSGFAIFRTKCTACTPSEGTVPLQSQFQSTLIVPYDNTNGFSTGVALANLSPSQAGVIVSMWDQNGTSLGTQTMALAGSGHTSFVMLTELPPTAGTSGMVQFQNPSGALDGIGLRFSPYGTFTSLPTTLLASPILPPPQIASLTPTSGQAGTSVSLAIAGSYLSGVTSVQFSPSAGITVSNLTATATLVAATVNFSYGVTPGAYTVSVTSPAGTSSTLSFTVLAAPPPHIVSLSSTSATQGSTVSLTISGSNLAGVTSVQFSPSIGIAVSNVNASATQVTATVKLSNSATLGSYNVSVTSPAGTSNTLGFTVLPVVYDGQWTGTSSQSLPVTLTISNNVITAFSFYFNYQTPLPPGCSPGLGLTSLPGASVPITQGSFIINLANGTLTASLSGTFQSGNSVSGNLSATLPGCGGTGAVTWNGSKN